jgi:hypothetical protein
MLKGERGRCLARIIGIVLGTLLCLQVNILPAAAQSAQPPPTALTIRHNGPLNVYDSVLEVRFEKPLSKATTARLNSDLSTAMAGPQVSQGDLASSGSGPSGAFLYCNTFYPFSDHDGTFTFQHNCGGTTGPWGYKISSAVCALAVSDVDETGMSWTRNGMVQGRQAPHAVSCSYQFHGTFNPDNDYDFVTYSDNFSFTIEVDGQTGTADLSITGSFTSAGCSSKLQCTGRITPDNYLNGLLTSYGNNATCANWSGGDATNSVALPNGERAWFFSDTYLNSPAERKTIWYDSALHNSIAIQDSGKIVRTITGGNTCQEHNLSRSFLDRYAITPAVPPDGSSGGFYWTGDQMTVGSDVVKFYYHGDPVDLANGGHSFTINYPAVAAIPVSSLERDSVLTIKPAAFSCGESNIIWGTALLNWDGDVYVYGWRSTGALGNGIFLARTPAAGLVNPGSWQLYDGTSGSNPVWGSCASPPAALPITDGDTGFSVDSVNNTLWLVQFDYTHGQLNTAGAIGAHPSATPWGFGNDTVALYDPPTGNLAYPYYYQDYEARIEPGLGAAGQVAISYNVNTSAVDTGCESANVHDAAIYRPRFIDVPVSDFNSSAAKPAPGSVMRQGGSASPAAVARPAPASAPAGGIGGVTDWYYKGLGDPCPAIKAPTAPNLSSVRNGVVYATWQNVGTDVWYYAWICDETEHNCSTEGTSGVWVPAWPTSAGNLWSTTSSAPIEPIAATSTASHSTAGDKFAIYVRSFGAGNGSGGGDSPEATVTVS